MININNISKYKQYNKIRLIYNLRKNKNNHEKI